MVQETPIDKEDIQLVLERLTACISDENTTISAWAMIGLAAYVMVHTRIPMLS